MRTFLHGLFARLAPPAGDEPGDDQLLAAFVASRDESAFQQIVRRHGPMVHGVCRRVLRNEADADDAFQAVFVVFLRKAEKVRPGNMLGNWLYGVAVNVARKGRELVARRRQHELAARAPVADAPGSPDGELREVIDQELSRLPADYRAAVVTCDLEGRTRREAASQLGWSEGTVASRLARARSILADRLTRRGVMAPATGLGVALAPPVGAAVPKVALTGHSEAVETLARATVNAMWTSKLKATAVALLAVAGLAGVGTGVVIACGGEFLFPTPRPASAAKPAPDRLVESRVGDGARAAWVKPGAGDATDKPGGANGAAAKPTRFVLRNPAGDITVVSDRDETFAEFFRRQRVMVAGITEKDFTAAASATKPSDRIFLNYASYNGDTPMIATYGSYLRLAPLRRDIFEALIDLPASLILIADAKEPEVWHAVGFTSRSSVGFFASKERKKGDDFAPADLHHVEKKKQ